VGGWSGCPLHCGQAEGGKLGLAWLSPTWKRQTLSWAVKGEQWGKGPRDRGWLQMEDALGQSGGPRASYQARGSDETTERVKE
jgi:hypothetical protein